MRGKRAAQSVRVEGKKTRRERKSPGLLPRFDVALRKNAHRNASVTHEAPRKRISLSQRRARASSFGFPVSLFLSLDKAEGATRQRYRGTGREREERKKKIKSQCYYHGAGILREGSDRKEPLFSRSARPIARLLCDARADSAPFRLRRNDPDLLWRLADICGILGPRTVRRRVARSFVYNVIVVWTERY